MMSGGGNSYWLLNQNSWFLVFLEKEIWMLLFRMQNFCSRRTWYGKGSKLGKQKRVQKWKCEIIGEFSREDEIPRLGLWMSIIPSSVKAKSVCPLQQNLQINNNILIWKTVISKMRFQGIAQNIARGTTDPGYWLLNLTFLSSLVLI